MTLARAVLLASAALSALASCGGDSGGCKTYFDCNGDQVCSDGVCKLKSGGEPARLGGACTTGGDCAAGLGCETDAFGFPGGLCSADCGSGCPAGSTCADLRSTSARASLCAVTCAGDAACRSGYVCCSTLGKVCLPPGLCPPDGLAASATLGGGCTAGADCSGDERCLQGPSFPGGLCSRSCAPGAAATCPAGARCLESAVGSVCLKGCAGAADCRSGWSCSVPAEGGGKVCQPAAPAARTCTPPGSPRLVSGGMVGPASAPASCVKPQSRSALPGAQVQRLGTHRVGESVTFTVPAGAGSVSIVSQAVSAGGEITYKGIKLQNTVVPTLVRGPDGAVLFDDAAAVPDDLATAKIYYGTSSPSTGVMTIPNTTAGLDVLAQAGALPQGNWSFLVNDYAAECQGTQDCSGGTSLSTYDVSVLVGPRAPALTGTLDLAFYLVGTTLTAASAPANSRVVRMVNTLSTLLGSAGICLGTVTFYDVPQWSRTRYATSIDADKDGPCDALSQMFTLARSSAELNFFLVQDIISGSNPGGQVVGIDGTIPGPSTLGGTVHSGAAVSSVDLSAGACGASTSFSGCGADRVAYIAAHEAGHWLGLYHTTEATGDSFDTLADTATCKCTSCTTGTRQAACGKATNPTLVGAGDCAGATCGGTDNLMFWLLDPTRSQGKLSAQQARVVRANPLVQ